MIMNNREIAQKLGISPAALSLVINNKPGVSDATRERVKNQLYEMGYADLIKTKITTPAISEKNANISFIIYKKSGKILGLHPFFLLIMESVEQTASSKGYSVLLNTIDCRSPLKPQLDRLRDMNVAGGIIFATEMEDEDMKPFRSLPYPVVALDNEFARLQCDSISINNTMGTWQAMSYLAAAGHQKIGYLRSVTRISSFEEREQGFFDAANRLGLTLSDKNIVTVDYTEDGSYRDIDAYLNKKPSLPDAFVCDDDTIASGAVRAFSTHGIRVPEDISIIGFNDRPNCQYMSPALTSVCVSRHGLASESVTRLIHLIEGHHAGQADERSRKIRIGTTLSIRNSVLDKTRNANTDQLSDRKNMQGPQSDAIH